MAVDHYGSDADQRRRATSVPERAGNYGHQRSPMGNPDGLRPGNALGGLSGVAAATSRLGRA